MPDFTKEVEKFTTEDLLDALYGEIQAVTERGKPDNVMFHYFLPPIPFGPELAAFMDIGRRPKEVDNEDATGEVVFTVNDMMRSAVNFFAVTDYIPTLGSDPLVANDKNTEVDLNSLISSGRTVSKIYDSVLNNCKVLDNAMTDEDREKVAKLRALLYDDPAPTTTPTPAAEPADEPADDVDALLEELSGDDDVDLDALLSPSTADAADFLQNPDEMSPPTKLMQLYQALENRYRQVEMATLEKAETISPNDPNAGVKIRALKAEREAALRRWEVQGKKKQVEAVMAKIAVMSRGGMPEYLERLQKRFEDNKLTASVFASEGAGVSFLTEEGWYTALRPNGILNAPSFMKVTLNSTESKNWSKTTRSKTSGGLKLPIHSLIASAGGSKSSERLERSFFSEGFVLSFEIVQGIIDRPWLDLAFLESPAYTTIDPDSKQPLDAVSQIVTLSDGKVPPTDGVMPIIPTTVYFARNLVVRSKAFATMSEEERKSFSGRAGVSVLGFGLSGKHSKSSTEAEWKRVGEEGEIVLNGQFLIGMASRFLNKAPDPDFTTNLDWV